MIKTVNKVETKSGTECGFKLILKRRILKLDTNLQLLLCLGLCKNYNWTRSGSADMTIMICHLLPATKILAT